MRLMRPSIAEQLLRRRDVGHDRRLRSRRRPRSSGTIPSTRTSARPASRRQRQRRARLGAELGRQALGSSTVRGSAIKSREAVAARRPSLCAARIAPPCANRARCRATARADRAGRDLDLALDDGRGPHGAIARHEVAIHRSSSAPPSGSEPVRDRAAHCGWPPRRTRARRCRSPRSRPRRRRRRELMPAIASRAATGGADRKRSDARRSSCSQRELLDAACANGRDARCTCAADLRTVRRHDQRGVALAARAAAAARGRAARFRHRDCPSARPPPRASARGSRRARSRRVAARRRKCSSGKRSTQLARPSSSSSSRLRRRASPRATRRSARAVARRSRRRSDVGIRLKDWKTKPRCRRRRSARSRFRRAV